MRLIVCTDKDWAIGCEGNLIYHIPTDMKRFKSLTMGHTVLMGANTFKSIGKPLPGRKNIVVIDPNREDNEIEELKKTYESNFDGTTFLKLVSKADLYSDLVSKGTDILHSDDTYLIGGATMYREFMRYCDTLEITLVYPKNEYGVIDMSYPDNIRKMESIPKAHTPLSPNLKDCRVVLPQADTYIKGFDFWGVKNYINRTPVVNKDVVLRYTDIDPKMYESVQYVEPFTHIFKLHEHSGIEPCNNGLRYDFITFKRVK
jgi:dihydrofolate reductase